MLKSKTRAADKLLSVRRSALFTTILLTMLLFVPSLALAQCPPGYTNMGLTCFRGADTISNGGSRVADCPAGYTNTGATCFRGAHSMGNGGSRVADCTKGTNIGLLCTRGGSMKCNAGEFLSGGRCYKNCPAGYRNMGLTCFRGADTLGMGSMTCNTGEFKSGARCYQPCPVFYTNTGVSCFRPASTLPKNGDINWITPPEIANQPVYIIAHMTNTDAAVDWAVGQGANGVENDLHFDRFGKPTEFRHGGVCDCICVAGTSDTSHVCSQLGSFGNRCEAKSDAVTHLNHIARKRLALVYIDSKVDKNTNPNAGSEIIKLLEKALFGAGFNGIVIVAAPDLDSFHYLLAAAAEAQTAPHRDRIYFGFDQVNGGKSDTLKGISTLQQLPSKNLVYGAGITSCAPTTYYSETSTAVRKQVEGVLKMTGIWTLDSAASMDHYLDIGVRGIMTNQPSVAASVVASRRLRVATMGGGLEPFWTQNLLPPSSTWRSWTTVHGLGRQVVWEYLSMEGLRLE